MRSLAALFLAIALTACSRPQVPEHIGPHQHHPPHGGTPVVLGDDLFHLELVLDSEGGTLGAYVLDGEMDDFVRIAAPSFEMEIPAGSGRVLVFHAVPNPATGESVGNTAYFVAQADWLHTTPSFTGRLRSIEIRGVRFSDITFPFPKGNDSD